ncbi:dihydrofolate reductase [Fictibacillus aquaticus]|uniref:Dihydrofolate reductase n=1 Tax=Fictibacillus aquaticus TaxID=2021314 RepID=A0A235F479_9BACL|nr:dihydrofolate reductase [Fictibacillus aquaticus]OYD56034.1 dihydrofolate reductase [Fictibacillus aquaticus]
MISFVVAMDQNRLIGRNNELPWHMPGDLQYFKKVTMGKPIVMGRKTHESIGRPLPGRENIVMTRDERYEADGCTVVSSAEDVLSRDDEEMCVIGGADIFRLFMPHVKRLYITEIYHEFDGDTYFPVFSKEEWKEVSREKGITDEKTVHPHDFVVYEKKK